MMSFTTVIMSCVFCDVFSMTYNLLNQNSVCFIIVVFKQNENKKIAKILTKHAQTFNPSNSLIISDLAVGH